MIFDWVLGIVTCRQRVWLSCLLVEIALDRWSDARAMNIHESDLQGHLAYLQSSVATTLTEAPLRCLDQYPGLPPFLRSLLVADGTVTLLLSAYFREDIVIETSRQSMLVMPSDLPVLGLRAMGEVFIRQVQLLGSVSGKCYAIATSLINPAHLPSDLFEALIDENVGMGEVLRNSARGSYREVLHICQVSEGIMRRTYAVFLQQRPAILITEDFNTGLFE